jgi:hypothetical protein
MQQQNIKERLHHNLRDPILHRQFKGNRDTPVTSGGVNLAITKAITHVPGKKKGADSNGIPGSSIKLIIRHLI